MVERFVSDPLDLAPIVRAGAFSRADLILYGVDHSGASYEGRLYLNDPDASAASGRDVESYAGSFHIFGHGGCFGDLGHCDVPNDPRYPFDLRPAHQLTPQVKAVIITGALKSLVAGAPEAQRMTVTVVAVVPGDASSEVLHFDELRLLTYL